MNDRGEVVGVVVGKVDAMAAFLKDGDLPERINFAIPIDECKGVISAAYPFGYPPPSARQKLEPSAIFGAAKPAVAFVVARAPSQAGDSTQPGRQSFGKGGVNLGQFISAFIDAGGSHSNPLAELPFYADNVDYFNHGVVNPGFIVQDIQKYVRRWPRRRYWIDGEVRIAIVDQQQDIAEATFRLHFAVQNAKKTVTGICDDVVLIRHARSNPKIIAIKSKSIRRSEEPTSR